MKLTVMLGYWEGDKAQAMEVARLLADLLPAKSEIASLFFCHRFDSSRPDQALIDHCSAKFAQVHVRRCHIQAKGFPGGCNAIAYSIMSYTKNNIIFKDTECFLILESDCVITNRTWDTDLYKEFRKAKSAGKWIAGNVLPHGYHHGQHVNAVAVYDRAIAHKLPILCKGSLAIGWDFYYGNRTAPVTMDTPLIYMDYRKPSINRDELFHPRKQGVVPVVFHGTKDNSAIHAVRKEYNL